MKGYGGTYSWSPPLSPLKGYGGTYSWSPLFLLWEGTGGPTHEVPLFLLGEGTGGESSSKDWVGVRVAWLGSGVIVIASSGSARQLTKKFLYFPQKPRPPFLHSMNSKMLFFCKKLGRVHEILRLILERNKWMLISYWRRAWGEVCSDHGGHVGHAEVSTRLWHTENIYLIRKVFCLLYVYGRVSIKKLDC